MSMFRKKPVVIEAVRVTACDFNPSAENPFDGQPFSEFPSWLISALSEHKITPHSRGGTDYAQWDIQTLEGTMTAQPGDWVILGVKGEIYPCKPDIFAQTYEIVGDRA